MKFSGTNLLKDAERERKNGKPNSLHLNRSGVNLFSHMKYEDIITIESGKRGAKPCIRGMRITVYDVLGYLASGMTQEEILHDFSYLTPEDIQACLMYAADRERHQLVVGA